MALWRAKNSTNCAVYGTVPILKTILVFPLNKKNKKCAAGVLIQAL